MFPLFLERMLYIPLTITQHPAAQPHLPPHSELVQPRLHVCGSTEPGVLSHPHPLRAQIH